MHAVRASRILIVADEPALLRLLGRLLEQDGYSVITADPAETDIATFRLVDPPFDVVVINSYLPDLGGSEATDLVQSLFPGTAVIHVDDESHGPFSLDRLLDRVHRLSSEASGQSEFLNE